MCTVPGAWSVDSGQGGMCRSNFALSWNNGTLKHTETCNNSLHGHIESCQVVSVRWSGLSSFGVHSRPTFEADEGVPSPRQGPFMGMRMLCVAAGAMLCKVCH